MPTLTCYLSPSPTPELSLRLPKREERGAVAPVWQIVFADTFTPGDEDALPTAHTPSTTPSNWTALSECARLAARSIRLRSAAIADLLPVARFLLVFGNITSPVRTNAVYYTG
ncbi:hypothetical protein J6590_062366 [Homalodisca vitripennis]|nr:hypothetical protein J6590_062366 [Homalodisca vitripennis]